MFLLVGIASGDLSGAVWASFSGRFYGELQFFLWEELFQGTDSWAFLFVNR